MNKFKSVRRAGDAFNPDAGQCELKDGNMVISQSGLVAIPGLVMTTEITAALSAPGARHGVIPLTVTDNEGNKYCVEISTKFAY